jgi:hypothetical protein
MSFTPTTAQLEVLAELEMARMLVALIANRLGVDQATCSISKRQPQTFGDPSRD